MKPLRLALQAFGPFWNRVEVDFGVLQSQGLFLIHGPVGSGKTTLLDGICFCLYGVSSGGERSPAQLRCDLAPESATTQVEFDFEAAGTQWRVIRQLSSQGSRATLAALNAEGQAGKAAENEAVEQQIHRLLGLDAFQFCRSVLLPQGQFRQFLLAGAAEREQILAALFHTHSPRLYQDALQHGLSQVEEELNLAWRRRENATKDPSGETLDIHESLRTERSRLQDLEAQIRRWKEQSFHMQKDRERVAVIGERSRERQRVRQELEQLQERTADLEELKGQSVRMQKALKLVPQVEQWQRAQHEETMAVENFRKAELELKQRLESLTPPEESAGRLEQLQRQRQEIVNRLQSLDSQAQERERLSQAEEKLLNCRQTWHQLEEEGQTMVRELRLAETRLQEIERFSEEEKLLLAQVEEQQKRLESLREGFKLQRQQQELAQGLERIQQNLLKVGERRNRSLNQIEQLENEMQERTRQLELHWSWSLAQHLEAGKPCTVCGSLEHPQPAGPGGSSVQLSLEQLRKQIELHWKQAEKIEEEEHELQINLVRLEERLDSARAQASQSHLAVSDPAEVQNVSESLRDLEKQLQRLQHYRENRERDLRRVSKLKKRLKRWREARDLAQQSMAQAEAIVEERRNRLEQPPEANERSHLEEALQTVERQLEGESLQLGQDTHLYASFVGAAEAARQSIELSQERTRLSYELVKARLELGGFSDLEEWQSIHRSAQQDLDSILHELQSYEVQRERLEEDADRAELLYQESLEDWQGLEMAPEQLEKELQTGYAEQAACQERIRQLERAIADYERAILEIQILEPKVAQLKRICRAAQGDNAAGVSFQQWVLAQQMENVLQSANQRLSQMTRGRFTLESGRSALELQVLDHLSGQSRSVTTLSGGESFLASLALALGLSDSFLMAGNQAILDTLFIDEGFGYLDEEGLDQAFWALEPIRQDGRILGLVSHLAEMRQRIPLRLEVRPSPSGTQLLWNSGTSV